MGYFVRIPAAGSALALPVLGLFDADAARSLAARATREHLPRGSEIYRQGGLSDTLFLLDEGKAALLRRVSDGRGGIVALLGPGDVLGEACVLTGRPYAMSARAVTDVTVLAVPTGAFTDWLAEHPVVLPQLMAILARRMRCATETMTERASSEVAARVARELLLLAERFGVLVGARIRVQHDLTQDELAQLVGSCRETVNKALGDFSARGWIQVEAKAVQIIEPERLAQRARTVNRPCTPRIDLRSGDSHAGRGWGVRRGTAAEGAGVKGRRVTPRVSPVE
jgi:CRP/FNR family transcriptional regulator, cyclic AMP receptor protein